MPSPSFTPYGSGMPSPIELEESKQEENQDLAEQTELGNNIKERSKIGYRTDYDALENDPLDVPKLRYPLDLGSSNYRHMMRIFIYKQKRTSFTSGEDATIGGRIDETSFGRYAGASKVQKLDLATGTTLLVQGAGAASAGAISLAGAAVDALILRKTGIQSSTGSAAVSGAAGLAGVLGKGLLASFNELSTSRSTELSPAAYITLYMPETMQVTDRHDYDAVSFTEVSGLTGVVSAFTDDANKQDEILARVGESAGFFEKGIVDATLYSRGYAMNPLLEILYKGTKNREFVYQFKFVPRNPEEAEEILSIIRTLRFHASPEYAPGIKNSRYFIPPSEFEIEYFIDNARNQVMPRIGKCVLTNIDVNYAPSGQYSTYSNGVPTEISVQLTFTETVVLTKEDIKIGY